MVVHYPNIVCREFPAWFSSRTRKDAFFNMSKINVTSSQKGAPIYKRNSKLFFYIQHATFPNQSGNSLPEMLTVSNRVLLLARMYGAVIMYQVQQSMGRVAYAQKLKRAIAWSTISLLLFVLAFWPLGLSWPQCDPYNHHRKVELPYLIPAMLQTYYVFVSMNAACFIVWRVPKKAFAICRKSQLWLTLFELYMIMAWDIALCFPANLWPQAGKRSVCFWSYC